MRVLTAVGNRPQFVKAAPLSLALRAAAIEEVVVHTGQHWDRSLSEIFFEELKLAEPQHRLDLRTADVDTIARGVEPLVRAARPDAVVVLGDTNSTAAAARAAVACSVPVAHVEAGLRSGDLEMPEERNRIEVDHAAELLLCPDDRSAETLRGEGVGGRIAVVGDVMGDATRLFAPLARSHSRVRERLGLGGARYAALTIHRAANTEPERLRGLLAALAEVDAPIVFPVHPRTRAVMGTHGLRPPAHVREIEPLGYLDMLALVAGARCVLTDSGGLQKEAYWLRVPCVTLRPSTEWVDTVLAGANTLVDPADPRGLAAAVAAARYPAEAPPLYGDGEASARVAAALSTLSRS